MTSREYLGSVAVVLILFQGTILAAAGSPGGDPEWERTVKAAEQEGQVVVYKLGPDAEWHAFQKKFPKIKLTLVSGGGAENLQLIMAERRAGKFLGDVVRLGGGTATTLLKAQALDPIPGALVLPEVKDASKWFE